MQILDRINDQIAATSLPLVGITLAAVPCPDTPVILTLHWHGFIKEKLADLEEAEAVSYTPIPSSALGTSRALSGPDARVGARRRPRRSSACKPSVLFPTASTAARLWWPTRPMRMSCSNWRPDAAT
jgi:hypothetical protein